MPQLVLPKISSNPNIDHSQGKLIQIFQQLVSTYNPPGELPFDTAGGVCSGIVANWLYRTRIGEEELFINRLEFALKSTPNAQNTPAIADLMNDINFLQLDQQLREGVLQDDYATSFDLALPKHYPRIMPIEFAISFVFNLKSLTQLIIDTVFENKMVRFDNGFHTIGLIYNNKKYFLLDPEASEGPIYLEVSSVDEVATKIMDGLSRTCKSLGYVAIYMSISDVADVYTQVVQYPNAIDYCKELLADPTYKQAVINHKNILHLNMRYNNYKFQDLLFPDYKYVPWDLTKDTEYEEAIISNDIKKIRYLASLGIPLDYKAPGIISVQPVTRAIFINRMDMLYLLLQLGANPNVTDENYPPRINYILRTNNYEALILLLAAGMELKPDDMKRVIQHFKLSSSQVYALTAHVLLLHAKMFDKPLPVAPAILEKLDSFVHRRTNGSELTPEHKLEMGAMLEALQQVAETSCDVADRARAAQDEISKYVSPKPKAVMFSGTTQQTVVDFERYVKPLLNLSFN